jgi:hypothetical protein
MLGSSTQHSHSIAQGALPPLPLPKKSPLRAGFVLVGFTGKAFTKSEQVAKAEQLKR